MKAHLHCHPGIIDRGTHGCKGSSKTVFQISAHWALRYQAAVVLVNPDVQWSRNSRLPCILEASPWKAHTGRLSHICKDPSFCRGIKQKSSMNTFIWRFSGIWCGKLGRSQYFASLVCFNGTVLWYAARVCPLQLGKIWWSQSSRRPTGTFMASLRHSQVIYRPDAIFHPSSAGRGNKTSWIDMPPSLHGYVL